MDAVISAAEPPPPPPAVVLVSAGASHSVTLLAGNVLCSWGRGEDGQLGHGDAEDRLVPTVLSGFDARGSRRSYAAPTTPPPTLRTSSRCTAGGGETLVGWGMATPTDVFTPQPVKALQGIKIKQIACGDSHCLAVTMTGEVQSLAGATPSPASM
ncbi:hypothetical protein GUJ93_ZPchr0769g2648 [Zizania palustris]|uniref:Uncharacterized protein n=1 Tax=Zizania palustris TaxID=103762 RepID=A0A8J5R3A6_ZIZPA|nr:hypothetical protein GUJ93_ZPchr0769g2648 [Zizania palustris]